MTFFCPTFLYGSQSETVNHKNEESEFGLKFTQPIKHNWNCFLQQINS